MAKFTITVTATLNGKSCKNPQIEFIQGEGYIYPCEIKDGVITIEILPGAPANACIEGYIKCDDTCLNCPPQYFKKCLCNDVTVLTVCQRCVDGFIVEICTPEQLAQGMICTPDGCVCPPDKPVKDPNTGQCVQCITGTVQGCKVCLGGTWVTIDCGPNEVCKDGKCECAPGYVRDPFTGECVPPPQCSDDEDCGICETCVNGVCVPVVCPPNHRCIDGICVYWPCTSVTCNNGADCGEDCGCLNGECVPCHLLNCKLDASCQSALGCRCNALDLCEPVPDCGQYCDGETPCLDTNCTCYNNRCVDCSRFPCPEDCATHYNCGCNAEGDCDGGKACTDTLTLKKEEVCSNDGCQLVADYTTENKCMCDPIEFRISNTRDCTGEVAGTVLVLKTEIFKNNLPYKDYLSIVGMGDDELVSGTITTHIDFFTKNSNGLWIPETVTNAPVANVSIVDNKIDLINITPVNLGFLAPNSVITANRKVVITLRATGVEIPNNDCKKYNSAVIATYEIDLTASTIYCPVINSFKTIKSTFLKDTVSTRRPLFVWSKSTTGTFANTKFVTNGVYTNSGWFRKEYGNPIAGKWQDKINNPKRGAENQFNELWNNYNYKVKVDCGCKSNDATLQKVVFCCPKEFDYTITDCGRTISLQPFDTCSVNKYLGGLFNQDYIIPAESQTYYWMVINGTTELSLKPSGGNLTTPFTHSHTEPITSVTFEQRYTGSPLVATACPVSYVETPVLPEFNPVLTCNPTVIDVIKVNHPNLQSVKAEKISGLGAGPTIYDLANQTSKFTTATTSLTSPLRTVGSVKLTATFTNGCKTVKTIDITGNCSPVVTAVSAPSAISYANCVGGGSNPDIVAQPSGFGPNVEYSLDGVLFQSSPTFSNKAPGVYTVTARETIDGVLYTAVSAPVTITAAIQPTISVSGGLCANTTATLTIAGAPSSTFILTLPNGSSSIVTLNAQGIFNYTVPSTGAGTYVATLNSNPTQLSCSPVVLEQVVTSGGSHLTPTIVLDGISCQGQPRRFRIDDGGANQTYTLSAYNGTLSSNTVTASATFDNTFTPDTTNNSSITIAGIGNSCYTYTTVTQSVPSTAATMINYVTSSCMEYSLPNTFQINIYTTGPVPTTVFVDSFVAALVAPNEYVIYGYDFKLAGETIVANVTSGACTYTEEHTLPICTPDQGFITIVSNSPTCGQMNTTVDVTEVDFGYIIGEFFQWYRVEGGVDVAIAGEYGVIVGNVPSLTVYSTGSQVEYKVKIHKANGSTAESNIASVIAGNALTPLINGAISVGTGVTTQYTATPAPIGATYQWLLTNSIVTDQPVGNTSSISISFTTVGNNTLSLNMTSNGCSGSAVPYTVNVTPNCPTVSINPQAGSCANLTSVVNVSGTGTNITLWQWLVNNVVAQSGASTTVTPFDASILAPASVSDIILRVFFGNGCVVESTTLSYTRCSDCCISGSCTTTSLVTSTTTFQPHQDFSWGSNGAIFITDPVPIVYDNAGFGGLPTGTIDATDPWAPPAPDNRRANLSAIRNGDPLLQRGHFLAPANAVSMGFFVDNIGQIKVNGNIIFDLKSVTDTGLYAFSLWWVIDYAVSIGDCIEFYSLDESGFTPFGVGFEFYSANIVALQALANVAAIDAAVVFSSQTLVATSDITAYTCSNGGIPTTGCSPTCNCP